MSKTADEFQRGQLSLPAKRVDVAKPLRERLTSNAYSNILPARYLKKDRDGNIIEDQEDLFPRVAKNIALAEAAYTDEDVIIRPKHIKPTHSQRDELIEEVFGGAEKANTTVLTEENVKYVSYDAVIDDLPKEAHMEVRKYKVEFEALMESLAFMPNSPTLMNAGGELQQLSACFVDSPGDDMEDIHQTAKEAAKVFQSGGGMGYGFWKLRPYGDPVGSTGGIASGPLTFMETFDQMCETIAQGGTRRGAQMAVMRVSHPDVIEFIHSKNKDVSLAHCLRLNDPKDPTNTTFKEALEEARELIGEDGRVPDYLRNAVEGHLNNFNISVGVTDGFMEALENDEKFTFMNPRTGDPHIATEETKELWSRYGLGELVTVGEELEVSAEIVWERIIEGAHENGEPGVIYLERANKEHSFDVEEHPEHRILATNPCVTGETLIPTGDGLKRARELAEEDTEEIVVDNRLSEDTVKKSSGVYQTGVKDVLKIETSEGYELRLTPQHRVMTDDGWAEAQNLESGDSIHIQDSEGQFGTEGTASEGRVLGWLVGDGWIDYNADASGLERAVLGFYDDDCELSEQYAEDITNIVRPSQSNNSRDSTVKAIRGDGDGEVKHERVSSQRIDHILEETRLHEDKLQVPDKVLRGSEEYVRGFLRGLFSADGHVQGSPESSVAVVLTSISESMLKDVQRLLLNFGIKSSIYLGSEEGTMQIEGQKEYDTQECYNLHIRGKSAQKFSEKIGFQHSRKQDTLESRLGEYTKGPYAERFEATVESVTLDGHEAVYDLTEPDTQSFVANGVVVHNCGEQPLEEYEACNLGHINLSTIASHNRPDWREWEGDVSSFLNQAIDWEEFDQRIELGTRFLENVVTMSDFPVERIEEKVSSMRKIGLGVMGLAQLYIQLGVKYGTDTGDEIARQLMTHINHKSKWGSHGLANERGNFDEWDKSKYANPVKHKEWFEKQTNEPAERWEDGFPIRNHNTTTIAPTGTTSMIGNTSGGCEPIYNVAYYKNVSQDVQGDEMLVEFDDYFLRTLEANDISVSTVREEAKELMADNEFDGVEDLDSVPEYIAELFVTAHDLTAKQHASVQCACQEGVDSAISKTCNFPNDATVEDMGDVYRFIYRNGGKGVTVYRDGTRNSEVLTTDGTKGQAAQELSDRAVSTYLKREYDIELDELNASPQPGEVVEQSGEICDDCGSELEFVEGCKKCPNPDCDFAACNV